MVQHLSVRHRMFNWGSNRDHQHYSEEIRHLLPQHQGSRFPSAIPAKDVTKVAQRLKYLIETTIPVELDEERIIKPHSNVITRKVVDLAKQAGGDEHKGCVVYCLLVCKKWFKRQAILELWDSDLHDVQATACEVIAKAIIESEEDQDYLFQQVLLKRYSVVAHGEESAPTNAVERAVDLHATRVISSSGYQKCIKYLWRGWLVQDEMDPSTFVPYKQKANTSYWSHFDPNRMRAPVYQNWVQMFFSFVFLGLYTGAINTINPTGDLDLVEGLLYVFTVGFIADEISKFWKIGRYYIGFWNIFNSTLYVLLTVSFVTRMLALSHPPGDTHDNERSRYNHLSYNFLAFSAPMFWLRLLLYMDSFRFFGAMIVVVGVMMKESLIFFALLFVVAIGFLQAFVGMDNVDETKTATGFILQAMANTVMQSPDFSGFENFAPPFGLILYYLFTFIVMVVLLNILIALYNSAYTDITDNSIDEFMALFTQKTLQFVRAPDENVFIAPFNLIEILFLIVPFEWWMDRDTYEYLNNIVMGIIYSPLLLITATIETREAHKVVSNRRRGEADDDTLEEWEETFVQGDVYVSDDWKGKVEKVKPNIEDEASVVEVRNLRGEVKKLMDMMAKITEKGKGKEVDGDAGVAENGS